MMIDERQSVYLNLSAIYERMYGAPPTKNYTSLEQAISELMRAIFTGVPLYRDVELGDED